MKQVLIEQGRVLLEDVPSPRVQLGSVLVQVNNSCISIGTEMSGVRLSGVPLWKRALQQPEKVHRVIKMVTKQGIRSTRNLVRSKIVLGQPTGYSAAGTVIEVGEDVGNLRQGDRVACAGAQCAFHAEVICVPQNLTVRVPEGVSFAEASTVTLGAIALQGVRRSQPTLGETFLVIGLGVVGQIVTQILKANGCRVIGTDLDRKRISLAQKLGVEIGFHPDDENGVEKVARLTDGFGADGAVVTAATSSNEVVSTAFKMCRKKGRVVVIGDVGLNLNRSDIYYKELDFFISSSYGPGRYDQVYEEQGLDYPVPFVRWTENRNLAEFLRLVDDGSVDVKSLIGQTYPLEKATDAYEGLKKNRIFPPMSLLSYPGITGNNSHSISLISRSRARANKQSVVRIAVIGAGDFSKFTHLPNLKAMPDQFCLQAIVSRSGHNTVAVSKQFGASYATTNYQDVLEDSEVDAVLITTRHDLHAKMALDALQRGKHVLVEKPLALTRGELKEIEDFYHGNDSRESLPVILTGFNRRFSPSARRVFEIVQDRSNPMILNYRLNAGYLSLDHWMHTKEGGGRNLGEACHIYDLFTCLSGSRVKEVTARAIAPKTSYYSHQDNFVATISFDDGSVASLIYTALGTSDYPKEMMEIFVDGKVLSLNDYTNLSVMGMKGKGIKSRIIKKGHKEELEAFARSIREGGKWPIPLWQQIQATEIAFQVEDNLRGHF